MKKGRLNKVEKYYLETNPDKLTLEEMARELDRNPSLVRKYYKDLETKAEEPIVQPPEKKKKPEALMFQLMGRKERGGQHVATIMTKAASELADSTRPQRLMNKKMQRAVHKPKD